MASAKDPVRTQFQALGAFIRSQRTLANLSLRELAARTDISNPYLSQIERGLHEPSVRVLKSLAKAGLLEGATPEEAASQISTEAAIRADAALSEDQKKALLGVYRSYVSSNRATA